MFLNLYNYKENNFIFPIMKTHCTLNDGNSPGIISGILEKVILLFFILCYYEHLNVLP